MKINILRLDQFKKRNAPSATLIKITCMYMCEQSKQILLSQNRGGGWG